MVEGQEIKIATKVVDGLMSLNKPPHRNDIGKDKSYVKALLITINTLKGIQNMHENEKIPRHILGFIKGINLFFCRFH